MAEHPANTDDTHSQSHGLAHFAALFTTLDQTTKTNAKVAAMATYFRDTPDPDKVWTIALLSERRPKRTVTTTRLREWAAERAGIPLWLFEEAYPVVGDLAETISLVLPPPTRRDMRSLSDWITWLKKLGQLDEPDRKPKILDAWDGLDATERFVFNKLITGGLRVGVSQKLMTRALAKATDQDAARLTHRLMGDWTPGQISFHDLVLTETPSDDLSRPYPFALAHQLDALPEDLGPPTDWIAEWKWDGIRGQLIRRGGAHYLWSRGEDLITDRFPEFAASLDFLPDGTVIDGEILAWDQAAAVPLSFSALQKRIGRKTVPKKLLAEAPAHLLAYDLLEWQGEDLRDTPLVERRKFLDQVLADKADVLPITPSSAIAFETWAELGEIRRTAREHRSEGLMLKKSDSSYHIGRKRGGWWKWKLDPLTIDAVMIYAQSGHGRRANLFTDFTFAVWKGNELVPFAKAYTGLTDAEFRQITAWVRKNTQQRFGPVRQVQPVHVFEIAFEGIQASPRHKSGVALRFPRMSRWRHDKAASEANTFDDLKALLDTYG